jgi:mxaJ protein
LCSAFHRRLAIALLFVASSAQGRELRVCADPNNLPFSNDREEGFENRILHILAEELRAEITYTWWAQRRGFLRNTLQAGACDLVAGLPKGLEGVITTAPYYRSTYVFVTRRDGPQVASIEDPVLRETRIGVQLVGDDGWNTPPAHALARRGIVRNVRGFHLYADYSRPNPPARIIEAVTAGLIDVAMAWGPMAAYFAAQAPEPLQVTPVGTRSEGGELAMVFDIAMGVRRDDEALRQEIAAALARRRADVDAILAAYGVPRLDRASDPGSGR